MEEFPACVLEIARNDNCRDSAYLFVPVQDVGNADAVSAVVPGAAEDEDLF